ncbi:MAG: peptidyl-prolyl cis-trans isomerase [Phycisphaerae bacterium]|nr:peptidyl-prolyl cis-trans isomerase [Phycisphaerae bacterium]
MAPEPAARRSALSTAGRGNRLPKGQLSLPILTLLTLSLGPWHGCSKPDSGPKRADHAAAHNHRYHPDVKRLDDVGTPAGPSENLTAGAVTQPADIDFEHGPVGCPVLFVNGDTISVPEVLEPIYDDLRAKADTLSLVAYRNHLFRAVGTQVDYQVSMLLVYQEAKKTFSDDKFKDALDKEVDRMVKDVITRRYGGVVARYEVYLKALDLTMDQIKERARRQAMVRFFLHERFRPMIQEPTRRELTRYYETHPDEFSSTAKAELFLIEVPVAEMLDKPITSARPEELATARQRARAHIQQARQELNNGVQFETVAKKYCKGPRGKLGGGWGEVSPGAFASSKAKLLDVLFGLQNQQVSDIVEIEDGFFIVKCGQMTPAARRPFEQAQEQIIQRLLDEEYNRREQAYIQQLLSRATIRKRPEFFQAVLAAVPRPSSLSRTR